MEWTWRGIPILTGPENAVASASGLPAFGNPVLFPAVGRTWDFTAPGAPELGWYTLAGSPQRLRMPVHGLAGRAAWHQRHQDQAAGGPLELGYEWSPDTDERRECYPFDVLLQLDFRLDALSLEIAARVVNRGERAAPFALGFHPYFRLADPAKARVRLACGEELALDPALGVPAGSRAVDGGVCLTLAPDEPCDRVFASIGTPREALIEHAGPAHDLRVSFDAGFEQLVIYRRANANFICTEPWTRGLGGFGTLREPGWEQSASLNILPPGGTWQARLRYEILPRGQ
ncbi:MAG: hypothetical protein MUF04_01490 [Akkermansiaceae bacterium]|nr:hypothetical protein [Akkermansiaceae bacterium]